MKTSDVYLASALLSLGYKLETVDRTEPRHMIFVFKGEENSNLGKLDEAISKQNLSTIETLWANRSLVVNAFDYAEAIKRMKSIIHSS